METIWHKPRSYQHFDRPVCDVFARKALDPSFVSAHSFSPLIKYLKSEKRYKPSLGKTVNKIRPIMYASHRDACILSRYAFLLNERLEALYVANNISENVIAYRALGRANYDFAAEAFRFAEDNSPVEIFAFDVTGFFDNLDHKRLKIRLKLALGVNELPIDWYNIFRYSTRFRYVELEELNAHSVFGERIKSKSKDPIATISELKTAGLSFHKNQNRLAGIPQGTPISAALSNLYMLEFDIQARAYCEEIGALYRRYSDDILIVCPSAYAAGVETKVNSLVTDEQLELSQAKTEQVTFDLNHAGASSIRVAQYLGFTFSVNGPAIRPGSLSRQWRKMRKAFKRIRRIAETEIAAGRADKAFTKRLRRRFTALQFRNFSSYGRRSAKAFGNDKKIKRQLRRFERAVDDELDRLGGLKKP